MITQNKFQHFYFAQQSTYDNVLLEIRGGRKLSHWMWFIFPQLKGLGFSSMAQKYALAGLPEAADYLKDPLLGSRLVSISRELLAHNHKTARDIFDSPDDLKLRSSMTLFNRVPGSDPVFQLVLNHFYNGEADGKTLELLGTLP